MPEQILKDKNIIVTGSSRGIGRAIVEKAAECGANIWACARVKNEQFEEDMHALSKKMNVRIKICYFDMTDEESIKEAIKGILAEKLPIDILVNNAGMAYGGLMQMTPMNKLKEVFQVNFFSQILMMQLVSKAMIRQKQGNIINIASVGGIETNPGYLAYGSSKASLIWATKSISKELGPYNIRVNAVAPGLTNTNMGNYKSEDELQKVIDRTSLRRMAEPEEIADVVMFLASDQSSFITGHILTADGGRL